MLATTPSIEGLAAVLGCEPRVDVGPAEIGVVQYEVTYESEGERLSLLVLPLAAEVQLSLTTKNPTRIIRLALANVAAITATEDAKGKQLEVNFLTEEVQPLHLYIKPVLLLIWGNQQDSPERHPPWERD
jgi:hypothetical protein